MFIIVPKGGKRSDTIAQESPSQAGETHKDQDERGPVRTTIACDSCRIKKTKCNGQQPCSPCQRKQIICVYSRPTNQRDLTANEGRISLLQHQQRRLATAVQSMAVIIAKYESVAASCSPDGAFNLLELLNQYAPQHLVDEHTPDSILPDVPLGSTKRRRKDDESAGTPDQDNGNVIAGRERSFEIQPLDQSYMNSTDSNAAYQSMMYFIRSMTGETTATERHVPPSATQGQPEQLTILPRSTVQRDFNGNTTQSMAQYQPPLYSIDATQPWMDFVDWDTSLQNLQDSHEHFFGGEMT